MRQPVSLEQRFSWNTEYPITGFFPIVHGAPIKIPEQSFCALRKLLDRVSDARYAVSEKVTGAGYQCFILPPFWNGFKSLVSKIFDFYKNEIRAGKKNPLPWMDGRGKYRG